MARLSGHKKEEGLRTCRLHTVADPEIVKRERDNVAYQSHRHIANARNEIFGLYAFL